MTASAMGARPDGTMTMAAGLRTDRQFKYIIILPAVFILLFIGVFPLIYTLVASVQNVTMLEEDTSFHGLLHYRHLFEDARLWESIGHTLLITGVALPIELGLGLLMAFLFVERLPGRPVFVALLVLPTLIAPVVAGATMAPALRPPLRADQPGPRLDRGRAGADPLGHQAGLRLSGDLHRRDLAVDAVHVPAAAGRALQRRQEPDRGGRDRRRLAADGVPPHHPAGDLAGDGHRAPHRGLDLIRIFDVVWALTQGGPGTMTETLSIYTYIQGFRQFETSYTGAIAFLVIVVLTVLVIWLLRRMEIHR